MHNGNDKTEKLNTALVGAENERARESELRLKFAEELERARERADARVHELNYAKSYKNKLVREKSAAALRKKRELELLKDAERAAAEEKRQSELKLELDSLEERRSASASFIKNLSQKTSAVEDKPSPDNPIPKESAEEASNDSEKEATPTTVSQKTEEIAPEIRIESKRLFTKRSRYTVKRPVGINIKPMPFFMLPAPIYPNPPAPYHAPFMAPPFSPCESFVQNANEGLELAFAPQNQAAYDAPEAFCEEVPRGFSAAPFFAAPLAIKAVRNPRFYERQSAQSPAFELGYNAPADYPAFTDTDYASGNFEAFSDADHVSHRYGNYTDVDHAPHS